MRLLAQLQKCRREHELQIDGFFHYQTDCQFRFQRLIDIELCYPASSFPVYFMSLSDFTNELLYILLNPNSYLYITEFVIAFFLRTSKDGAKIVFFYQITYV